MIVTHRVWLLLPRLPLPPHVHGRTILGRARMYDRRVINGMVYKISNRLPWRDLPDRYGPWQTVYTRFRRYSVARCLHPGTPTDPCPG
ncbi:transposase [Streptomyces sp. NPDC018947]|uniref:transposase n=1 Tax=Streptomyces sp. NPDC018947 TaxID=3365054 RepID=UPI0037BBA29D